MYHQRKITTQGNSLCILIPTEMARQLHLDKGDKVAIFYIHPHEGADHLRIYPERAIKTSPP